MDGWHSLKELHVLPENVKHQQGELPTIKTYGLLQSIQSGLDFAELIEILLAREIVTLIVIAAPQILMGRRLFDDQK